MTKQTTEAVELDEYKMMVERCKAMTNALVELKKEYEELQEKIDKAIGEIRCNMFALEQYGKKDREKNNDIFRLLRYS